MKKICVKDLDTNKVMPILSVLKNKKNICIPETGHIGVFGIDNNNDIEAFVEDFMSLYRETWDIDLIYKNNTFSEVVCRKAKKRLMH